MPARGFFVTASGTELGKTLFTAALTWQLRGQGRAVQALKPVISGFSAAELAASDTGILLAAQGREVTLREADAVSPWRFAAPVSPHFAAQQESAALTAQDILQFCRTALEKDGFTLIEGAGGAFSPLVQGYTQADLLQDLGIPAIVLVGSYVGAISHTLATVEAMQGRGISVAAVVVSESAQSATSLDDTRHALASHLKTAVPLFTVPRICPKNNAALWQQLPPLTGIVDYA